MDATCLRAVRGVELSTQVVAIAHPIPNATWAIRVLRHYGITALPREHRSTMTVMTENDKRKRLSLQKTFHILVRPSKIREFLVRANRRSSFVCGWPHLHADLIVWLGCNSFLPNAVPIVPVCKIKPYCQGATTVLRVISRAHDDDDDDDDDVM